MHPNMAGYYRQQVSKLRDALDHPDNRTEAADILRTLIDRIDLKPVKVEGKRTLAIDLHGHLAGILSLANKAKGGIGEDIAEKCTAMVCGGTIPTILAGVVRSCSVADALPSFAAATLIQTNAMSLS